MKTKKTKMNENHFEASNIDTFETLFGSYVISSEDDYNIHPSSEIYVASVVVDCSSDEKKNVYLIVQNAAINKSIVVSYKYLIGKFHIKV